MSANLYELTDAFRQLSEAADDGADVGEMLAKIEDALEVKAANICRLLAQWEGDAEIAKAESKRLADRGKALENRADRLKKYLRDNMEAAGIKRIASPLFTATLCAGKPKVVILNEREIPPDYMRKKTTREPNKIAIINAYTSLGEVVPGTMIEETPSLRIK